MVLDSARQFETLPPLTWSELARVLWLTRHSDSGRKNSPGPEGYGSEVPGLVSSQLIMYATVDKALPPSGPPHLTNDS